MFRDAVLLRIRSAIYRQEDNSVGALSAIHDACLLLEKAGAFYVVLSFRRYE